MHRARVDDPHGEFIVRTSDGWGSDAGALEYAAAEASALRWASGATDDAEESRDALAEATDEDAARDVARLAPWEGGPPGRVGASAAARAGATLGSEAAWLRESTDARAHPLFAGMERVALATGVQLRVLQRLPQTASFARRFASIGVDEDDSDEDPDENPDASESSSSESSSAWRLAFSPAALASASSRRRRETAAMERAADDAIASMAATRAAHGARAEARRRARLAADVARRVESESLVAEARASLLEGFAERVAVIAARRERAKWRRAEEVEGFDAKANAASRAAEDEANIRAELARELAAAEARATPKPTEKTDANATRTPSNATRTPSNARTPPFSRSLSPADVGSSPGSYFRTLASDRLDASADAADESFRTADDAPASPDRSLDLSMRSADATMRSAPSTPGDEGDAPGVETRPREPDAFFATTKTPGSPDLADSIESDSDAFGVDAESVLEDAADLFSTTREDPLETPFPVTLAECVSRVVLDRHRVVSRLVTTAAVLDHLGAETHAAAVGKYILCGAGDFSSVLVEGVEAAARADAARGGWGATSHALRDALHAAVKESAASADPLAARA